MGVSRRPHARHARRRAAGCAVITVSDTRGPREDRSGAVLARALERGGHQVVSRSWVRDEPAAIRRNVRASLGKAAVDVVVLTGGTGLAPRDRTPEALRPLLELELPGFGERFRQLSYAQVGTASWLSRAGAGVARGRLIVWLPGSPRAVELAVAKLLLPELGHALQLLDRDKGG